MKTTRNIVLVFKLCLNLITVIAATKCGESFIAEGGRITGGREAKPGETPWLVALFRKKADESYVHFCGATILSEEWVITAAHCIHDMNVDTIRGAAAVHNLTMTTERSYIYFDKKIVHENYSVGKLDEPINDIALLHINTSLQIEKENNLNTICLPHKGEEFEKMMEVAGWGKVHEFGEASEVLKIAQIFKVNDTDCRHAYRRAFHKELMFCAGNTLRRTDSCEGDSGGPLVKRVNDQYYLAGLVSFGKGCGRSRFSGVYTRVSNYIDWINGHTKLNERTIKSDQLKKFPSKGPQKSAKLKKSKFGKYLRFRENYFNQKGSKNYKKIKKYRIFY